MFGTTLEEILASQNEKFPELEIPWIQRELTSEIIRLGGLSTEGIFRLPGEIDRVNALRVDVEDYHVRNADDAHVACSLLKLWLREMAEPIFPTELTEEILNTSENKEESVQIVAKLSDLTKSCLTHLIRFLQVFSKEEVRFSLSKLNFYSAFAGQSEDENGLGEFGNGHGSESISSNVGRPPTFAR